MIGELDAVAGSVEILRWFLGCARVILWEFLGSALLGVRRASTEWWKREEGIPMRNAMIAAAVVLAVAVGFFLTPSFRQGMSLAGASVIGKSEDFGWVWLGKSEITRGSRHYKAVRQRTLDRLRQEAVERGDPRLLAYVALEDGRPEAVQDAADRAVALDPQLTWIYNFVAWRCPEPSARRMFHALQQWDPQNAVTYLAEADWLAGLRWRPFRRGEGPPPVEEPWAATARAFDAPRYEAYRRQQFELRVEIARRRGVGDPHEFVAGLMRGSVFAPPPGWPTAYYADFVLRNAASPAEAAAQARRVAAFGERQMTGYTSREREEGAKIALKGYKKLEPLVSGGERTLVAARIEYLKTLQPKADLDTMILSMVFFRSSALLLMTCFTFIVTSALAIVGAGMATLVARGKASQRIIAVLWVAEGTMLVSSITGYLAYRPYASLLAEFLNSGASVQQVPLLMAFNTFPIANYVVTACFVVLLLSTAFILSREIRHSLRRSSPVAA